MNYSHLNHYVPPVAEGVSDAWRRALARLGDYTALVVRATNLRPTAVVLYGQTEQHLLVRISTPGEHLWDVGAGVEPPVALTSQRLVYDRKKRWLRVEGGANLRRGKDRLSARRIFGNLSDDESSLTFVHAFWDITGETHSRAQPAGEAPQPTTVRFRGKADQRG